MSKRILFLTFYFNPDLSAGSFRATALIEELKKYDVEIDILTTKPNRYSSFTCDASENEVLDNVHIHRIEISNHASGMLDQIKAYRKYFFTCRAMSKDKNYDLVFATSGRLFTAFLAASIARKKRIPLYLDVRDIFLDTLKGVLNRYVFLILRPFLKLVEIYSFKKAAKINLVSRGFESYFIKRFPYIQYDYFTNGIDQIFLENEITPKKAITKPMTILYAGNIGESQGLHMIVPQLASEIGQSYIFKIIGDGGRKKQLVQSISDLEVDNVVLLNPVSRKELLELYQQADILFLHLNSYDAFKKVLPSKLFEYGATNKPILAGVSGYAESFFQNEMDGVEVFKPCDVSDAVQSLKKLSLKSIDRSAFKEKFSRKNIMRKMSESIQELI